MRTSGPDLAGVRSSSLRRVRGHGPSRGNAGTTRAPSRSRSRGSRRSRSPGGRSGPGGGHPRGGTCGNVIRGLVYRQLMYLVVVQSVVTALLGSRLRWHRMQRTGTATETLRRQTV